MTNDEALIPRKDFYESLDIQEDIETEYIDTEECEILYLHFIDNTDRSLITIFKKFRSSYTDLHKIFLVNKIEESNLSEALFIYIIKEGSFNTLDLLQILPVSFFKKFCTYLCKNKYLFFLDTILEIQQVCQAFVDTSVWYPQPWYARALNDVYFDISLLYRIIKKLICWDYKLKNNFMASINTLIQENQDRNKMVYDVEKFISDVFAHNLNKLINKFLEVIIKKEMYDKISLRRSDNSFTNFVFRSKIEIFKLSYIKIIEERKRLRISGEKVDHIDVLLKDIREEESFGIFLGEVILKDNDFYFTKEVRDSLVSNNITRTELTNISNSVNRANSNIISNSVNRADSNIISNSVNRTELSNISNNISNSVDSTELSNISNSVNLTEPNMISNNITRTDSNITNNISSDKDSLLTDARSSYLYIFDILPPPSSTYNILKLLFQFDIHKQQVLHILVQNPSIMKFSLLNSIIDYYNKIQKEGHKIEIRYLINIIIVEDKSFSKLKICTRNIKFINNLMSDFEYTLSQGLSGISELNDLLKKDIESEDFTNINNHVIYVRMITQRVSNSFVFVETCFNLLNHIIKCNVDILLVDELINVFVKILNCNLKTIVGPKCSSLVLKNPYITKNPKNQILSFFKSITNTTLKFNPKDLLRNILLIYIGIKDTKFIKAVCNEEMYYDVSIFINGLDICENKYILNIEDINYLRSLIDKLKRYRKDFVEDDDDEFIDPLTYNPIKDPVRLLTSNITIDKSTYNMIMLNDGIDPFNREPLDDTKVRIDEEMMKKISEKRRNN